MKLEELHSFEGHPFKVERNQEQYELHAVMELEQYILRFERDPKEEPESQLRYLFRANLQNATHFAGVAYPPNKISKTVLKMQAFLVD